MLELKISLAAARVNAKMTQDEVSRLMHVSKKTIVGWESGRVKPSLASLNMMSQLYGIPIDNIFLPEKST